MERRKRDTEEAEYIGGRNTKGNQIMRVILLITAWLFVISIMDIRHRKVPVWMLLAGSVLAGVSLFYQCIRGERVIFELVKGLTPGFLLLGVSFATKNAGYGDGMAMLVLGMVLKAEMSFLIFGISLFCIAVFSLVLLVLRKAGRNTRIPYLPFLTAAWILVIGLQ